MNAHPYLNALTSLDYNLFLLITEAADNGWEAARSVLSKARLAVAATPQAAGVLGGLLRDAAGFLPEGQPPRLAEIIREAADLLSPIAPGEDSNKSGCDFCNGAAGSCSRCAPPRPHVVRDLRVVTDATMLQALN